MKKTFSLMLVMMIALTLVLSACGAKNNNEGGANTGTNEGTKVESDGTGKDFKIGMVTDVGGVHDKSFNQSAWEALAERNSRDGC